MRRIGSLLVVLALAVGLLPAVANGQDDEPRPRVKASQLIKSVVLINTLSCDTPPTPGQPSPVPYQDQRCDDALWKGSGSIIDGQGHILTNDHVVRPDRHGSNVEPESLGWHLIYLTNDAKELPVPSFYGRVINSSQSLDLAVLEPAWGLDGRPLAPGQLTGLPVLPMSAEPSTVEVEDTLRLLGYPRQHPLITVSSVPVVGFEPDSGVPEMGNEAWIRTEVGSAGPGNSGGPAVNDAGEQVGVVSAGSRNTLDCQDYNGDGVTDPVSECVTAAGGTEYLRPVPAAFALLQQQASPEPAPTEEPTPPEPPAETPTPEPTTEAPPEPPSEPTAAPTPTEAPPEPPAEPTATEEAPQPPTEPTPTPGPTEPGGTAIVVGTLVSAETGEPIVWGQVVVLNPGFKIQDWLRGKVGSEAVFTSAQSDGTGYFQLPDPVVRDQEYGIWIQANGYEMLTKDKIVLATSGDPAIVDLGTIRMPREQ